MVRGSGNSDNFRGLLCGVAELHPSIQNVPAIGVEAESEFIAVIKTELESENSNNNIGAQTTKCPFCPVRDFYRPCRLAEHIAKHHDIKNNYGFATRTDHYQANPQYRAARALFNAGKILEAAGKPPPKNLLRESANFISDSAGATISKANNEICRDLILVLTSEGPRYRPKYLGREYHRHSAKLYYDASFANQVGVAKLN